MAVTARLGFKPRHTDTVTIADNETGLNAGCVVYITAAHQVVALAVSDTVYPFGVLLHDAAENEEATVGVDGTLAGRAGDTYSVGVELTVNGAGEFIAAVSGDRVMGIALEAATAADALFAVRFIPAGPIKP